MKMNQIEFNIFVGFSILAICIAQTSLYSCNFDTDLASTCGFQSTPGAPTLQIIDGIASTTAPIQPLSDANSILLPTTPNGDYCSLPYSNPPSTWPMYFCQRNSATNYTCSTPSGTGNCVIGKYGLVKVSRTGAFDQTYTTMNNVQTHVEDFQCLSFYYYVTDAALGAKIDIGWSAGAAPFPLTEVKAGPENRWQSHNFTYPSPAPKNYFIWFQMLRDGGSTDFSYALDEIKVFDGPCEPLTTNIPTTPTSSESMSIAETESSTSMHFDFNNFSNTYTNSAITANSIISTLFLNVTMMASASHSIIDTETFEATIATNTEANVILSTIITSDTIAIMTSATPINSSPPTAESTTEPTKKPNLPLILGLVLGLGLPITLAVSGGLVYYFKVVKPKQKVTVHDAGENDIRMTSRHNTETVNTDAS
ncbi:unnamed protein product [Rotaria socialis]